MDKQTGRSTGRQTCTLVGRQAGLQASRYRQAGRQVRRKAEKTSRALRAGQSLSIKEGELIKKDRSYYNRKP